MKILFLDDDATRHNRFKAAHFGINITDVWSAEEAIDALKTICFDEVYLDHDLGGVESQMTLPDKNGGSGYDVAEYIANMPEDHRPYKVVIHSHNPAGAERMENALRACKNAGMIVRRKSFDY